MKEKKNTWGSRIEMLVCLKPLWSSDSSLCSLLQYMLQTNRFIAAHFTTIHWELVRAGISSKKIKKVASERNEQLRADFIGRMACRSNWAFLMRSPRMNEHLSVLMGDLVRELEQFRKEYLFEDAVSQLKDS